MIMHKTKQLVAFALMLIVSGAISTRVYAGPNDETQAKPWYKSMSWKRAACYTGAAAVTAYTLFKGYDFLMGKGVSSPIQDLSGLYCLPEKIAGAIVGWRQDALRRSATSLEDWAAFTQKQIDTNALYAGAKTSWDSRNKAMLSEAALLRSAADNLTLPGVIKEFVQKNNAFWGMALFHIVASTCALVLYEENSIESRSSAGGEQQGEQQKLRSTWSDRLQIAAKIALPLVYIYGMVKLMDKAASGFQYSIEFKCLTEAFSD